MPARTTKIRHDNETRSKIQAALLIDRLHNCAMGAIELSATQLRAAQILLNKSLPDLSSVEHTGTGDNGEIEIVTPLTAARRIAAALTKAAHT